MATKTVKSDSNQETVSRQQVRFSVIEKGLRKRDIKHPAATRSIGEALVAMGTTSDTDVC